MQGAYFDRVLGRQTNAPARHVRRAASLVHRERGRTEGECRTRDRRTLDRYTGTLRPSETLSGGETFLASLCAGTPGLSDVIMGPGGWHVTSMPCLWTRGLARSTRNPPAAVDVLGKLSPTIVIGIVSHVSDLATASRARSGSRRPVGSTLEPVL